MTYGGMNVDTAPVESFNAPRENGEASLNNAPGKIEEIGVVVKDLDVGLVDFPTLDHGAEVYICWRMDEASISHWHGLHEGFASRKETDAEFIANRRGEAPA